MCKRVFSFLIITISFLFMSERSWGQDCTATGTPPSCTNAFSPGTNVGVYNFPDGSSLTVDFVGGVNAPGFSLIATEVTLTDMQLTALLNPNVFPAGTTCFHYGGGCKEYNFTGTAGGPNGVPVKNVDYGPPIQLILRYFSTDPPQDPAMGHAPGEITTFIEDILVDYLCTRGVCSAFPEPDDDMVGDTPSLSSIIALNRLLQQNDTYCPISPSEGQQFTVGAEVQVEFQLFASGGCPNAGTPLRDHFARLSLANGQRVFQRVQSDDGGKDFHFDNHGKVNEREFSTAGLAPGFYHITVRSKKFSPKTTDIQIKVGP